MNIPVTKEEKILIDQINKEINKALREKFSKDIKGSFLIYIKNQVMYKLSEKIFDYYDGILDINIIPRSEKDIHIDICKYIIGVHKSNTMFLSQKDIGDLQSSEEYKNKLINEVINHIKLRRYAGRYFRTEKMFDCNEYLYYRLPYILFAMCTSASINENFGGYGRNRVLGNIINKSMAALNLIGDGLFDTAYPIVRAIIEQTICYQLIFENSKISDEYERFYQYNVQKQCNNRFADEFLVKYKNRKNKNTNNKNAYMNYGWLDMISDYHETIETNPYCFKSGLKYLKAKDNEHKYFYDFMEKSFNYCNGFSHGLFGYNAEAKDEEFYHIVLMLCHCTPFAYYHIVNGLEKEKPIEGLSLIKLYNEAYTDFAK